VFHPGSGSDKKNWPLQNWIDIGSHLLGSGNFRRSLIIVCGEADEDQVRQLESVWKNAQVGFAKSLPLPHLAAVLEHSTFLGHDSGISQLAAAAGADCILLFGPSDPEVWAPKNEKVQIIQPPTGDMGSLGFEAVRDALINRLEACLPEKTNQELMRIGIST
jgi:heptosyltransferase-2